MTHRELVRRISRRIVRKGKHIGGKQTVTAVLTALAEEFQLAVEDDVEIRLHGVGRFSSHDQRRPTFDFKAGKPTITKMRRLRFTPANVIRTTLRET